MERFGNNTFNLNTTTYTGDILDDRVLRVGYNATIKVFRNVAGGLD